MSSANDINAFCSKLFEKLSQRLDADEQRAGNAAERFEQRLEWIRDAMLEIKAFLDTHSFPDEQEEIGFFKVHWPRFLFLQLNESERFDLGCAGKIASFALKSELLKIKVDKINLFYRENRAFAQYYHERATCCDEVYFLRRTNLSNSHRGWWLKQEEPFDYPAHCRHVAKILVYSRLLPDLEFLLEERRTSTVRYSKFRGTLQWTDSKLALTELIYCLQEQGSFNNGQADLKTIALHFEKYFSVPIGNISSYFQKILCRKSGQTNYVDELKQKLAMRIEETEQNRLGGF